MQVTPWNQNQPRNNSSSSLCLSSIFRIAIWNRNIIVSLIAVGFWLGGLALHIRSKCHIPTCSRHQLMSRDCACQALTTVRSFRDSHLRCFQLILVQITQGQHDVHRHREYLRNPTYTQGYRQRSRGSRGRHSAPPDHADWAPATCAKEFNWHMETTLPTGDA